MTRPGQREEEDARRRVEQEHREIESLFAEARSAVAGGDRDRARRSVAALTRALETHFEQEDSLYYPTLGSLRPKLKETLLGLTEAHDEFRGQLRELAARLERQPEGLRAILEDLEAAFGRHEKTEEKLLESL